MIGVEDILKEKKDVKVLNSQLRGIYFLINEDRVVYVGQSVNCFHRINLHYLNKDGIEGARNKQFTHYYIIEYSGDLDELERVYIKMIKPEYNRTLYKHHLTPFDLKKIKKRLVKIKFN